MSDTKIEKTVYFVRHGQSADNASPVFQSPDSPLTDKGRAQAAQVAERVAHLSFETLISSPFQRAKETAVVITQVTDMQPVYSDLFVERMKPMRINGKSHADEDASAVWRAWEDSLYTPGMRVEDGENFDDLMARADAALDFLKDRPEESLLVVTHGYFLRTIVARVLFGDLLTGESFKRFQKRASMENTGLTVLRYQHKSEEDTLWRLWIYNDHAHLGE